MPKIVKPLTAVEIRQAKPSDKLITLNDGQGLYLRVNSNGVKRWHFNYCRPLTKKRNMMSLGAYPEVSLADARAKREEALKLLDRDIDPQDHKRNLEGKAKAELENTLGKVAKDWFELKKSKVSASHAQKSYRSIEKDILSYYGKTPLNKIKAIEIIETLKIIEAKGNLETVKRLCRRMNEIMSLAINSGLIASNPLANISNVFSSPQKQHQPTIQPNEMPQLLKDIANANIKRVTRCLIEWQLHTMVRPSEAAGARWAEINTENKVWTIPASRMKRKIEHHVPLTDHTLALLEYIKPISGHSEYIFPADRDPSKHANPSTANVALKRMGYGGKLVAHGLRALASTILNENEFNPDHIEAALAHMDKNQIRKAYNRANYLEARRELMNWWSKHIITSSTSSNSITQA